jgi:hypothetical protein
MSRGVTTTTDKKAKQMTGRIENGQTDEDNKRMKYGRRGTDGQRGADGNLVLEVPEEKHRGRLSQLGISAKNTNIRLTQGGVQYVCAFGNRCVDGDLS